VPDGWLTFLNPTFLWGVGGQHSVIIHLINRRRARVYSFLPSSSFCAPSAVSPQVPGETVAVAALRTLILFLLTTALAEPVLHPSVGELAEVAQARAVVLILDNTMSMAYQAAGMTSWDLAKEVSELVLQEFRPQDQGVVLPLVSTDAPPQALSGDVRGLMQQVSDLAQTFQPGGFVLPFQRAYALLKTSEAPKERSSSSPIIPVPLGGLEPATLKMIDRRSG